MDLGSMDLDALARPSGLSVEPTALRAVPPFDLHASLRAIAGFSPCAGEQELSGDTVRKAFAVTPTRAVVAEVSPADGGVRLVVRADGPLDATERTAVDLAVARWLSLDDDLRPFLALAADDPPLRPVLAAVAGLHQVRFASLGEAVTYFVLVHRTQGTVAAARKRRLAAEFGPAVTLDGVRWVAFPPLSRLAGLSTAELSPFTGRPQQTEYLASALRGVHDLGEEFLRTAPYDEAERALRRIRGIGPFTANAILMRALGRPDRAAVDMPAFAEAVAAVYGPREPPSRVVERYGRYAGWWSYLVRTGLAERARDGRG